MITDNLYQQILLDPLQHADRLTIISGYATPAMVIRHLNDTTRANKDIVIELIVGKVISDGIYKGDHKAYYELSKITYPKNFICKYYTGNKCGVHSKIYIWSKNNKPLEAFIGSANYTQNGFFGKQIEAMTNCNGEKALKEFENINKLSINCNDDNIKNFIKINDKPTILTDLLLENDKKLEKESELKEYINLSLLVRGNITPEKSGINWGQRPGRDPDQAYLSVPSEIQKSGFFPERGDCFIIHTDDGEVLDCKRAQDNGKAIETYENNSILGRYLRKRIGVPYGEYVTKEHLEKYGRTNITIYKISDESFYMDFSLTDKLKKI